MKQEMIALLLAGGAGSRLGILTKNMAKPAVTFGGKFRIIDFPLSNCINSGVDTVGVLTQYRPLKLNRHIGIGIPWDLDKRNGGVTILTPHVKGGEQGDWFMGTANAIYRNMEYIDSNNPEYVLILSGDHVYKMDYSKMLEFHKKNKCKGTIAVLEVPISEASRFGIMNTKEGDEIYEFEEKPKEPKNNLASMGIYIFNWKELREALIEDSKIHQDSDFGKHIIPKFLKDGKTLYAYRFRDYWRDVGTIESYWKANMDLIVELPKFNLYEDFWKIYTNLDEQTPIYAGEKASVERSLVSEGCEIYGQVENSVLSPNVIVEEGACIRDSIVMANTVVKKGAFINRCILDESCVIGERALLGVFENRANEKKPDIYNTGITVLGEKTQIPPNVQIGKNCVIYGATTAEDYTEDKLLSGRTLIKEGDAD